MEIIKKLHNKIKKYFHEIMEIKTTPNEVALGFAMGTAIAILPTFGLGILIGLLMMLIFKNINKISMFIAFAFWNPLLLIPLSTISFFIGDFILGTIPPIDFKFELFNQIYNFTIKFLVGNIIITIIATVASYFFVLHSVKAYQKKQIPILQKPIEIEVPILDKPVELKI